jgi:PII-like signaling protein
MTNPGTASVRLTIHLTGNAVWHHRPAYAEIVHRARREGLAGASVFHGYEGFGGGGYMHRERPGHIGAVGPCAVVIVDEDGDWTGPASATLVQDAADRDLAESRDRAARSDAEAS